VRSVTGILLAAGRATRFGGHKLLATLPDGMPVGIAAARRLRTALPEVVAVVRPGDTLLRDCFEKEGLEVIQCAGADRGLSASLRCGIEATPGAAGWVIALADMPAIQGSTIAMVQSALIQGATIAAPFYQGRQGHPVGFAASLREELLALKGDRGARAVLERHAAQLARVEVDDPGVLQDIDVPADLPTS
jgi:molybdenum cofactor cytidylyltransferase